MKKLGMLIVMFVAAALSAAERPPELGPADVPFVYDPNSCPAPVLAWLVIEPNVSSIIRVSAHNRWGKRVDLTVADAHDPNLYVLIDRTPMTGDPFNGYDQNWQCMVTLGVEGVHYLELTATDLRGRTDRRTLLMLCAADEPPFLFMSDPPVITKAARSQAQRLWQVAKKMKYPATKPTHVLN